MLLITCPWCGPREEPEFSYGGQAHVAIQSTRRPWTTSNGLTTCSSGTTRKAVRRALGAFGRLPALVQRRPRHPDQ